MATILLLTGLAAGVGSTVYVVNVTSNPMTTGALFFSERGGLRIGRTADTGELTLCDETNQALVFSPRGGSLGMLARDAPPDPASKFPIPRLIAVTCAAGEAE